MNKGLRVHKPDNAGKATEKSKSAALTTARTFSHSFKKLLKKTPSLLPSFLIVKTITVTALATLLGINVSYGQTSPSPSLALNPPGINISMDGEKRPDGDKTKTASTATVAVPDTARHMPNDARAKPKVEPKPEPMQLLFFKGSDGLKIGNGFGNISKADMASLGVQSFDGNEVDYVIQTPNNNYAHCVMNKNWTGILIIYDYDAKTPGLERKINQELVKTKDKFFMNYEAIYQNPNAGIFVATTPTSLIVKTTERAVRIDYNEIGLPTMKNPSFRFNASKNMVEMRDEVLKNGKGENVVIGISIPDAIISAYIDDGLIGKR